MTLGDLSEEDVEGIKTGKITDPTVGQVAALAAAFGVAPSYLVDRGTDPSVLDEETLEALADETAAAILSESAPPRAREGYRSRHRPPVREPARGPSPRETEQGIVPSRGAPALRP
jgi:hypothetical protein